MGMEAEFEQITPQQLEVFLQRPSEAYDYILAEFFEDSHLVESVQKMLEGIEAKTKSEVMPPFVKSRFEEVAAQMRVRIEKHSGPRLVASKSEPADSPARKKFSLEKDWHVMHYALNGTAKGGKGFLADAILGGAEIPDVDGVMGYGPIRYLRSQHVKRVVAALADVDPGQLLSKLDREDAEGKQIYLAHTLENLADWTYLPDLFNSFRDFYTDAERNGSAMLLWLT